VGVRYRVVVRVKEMRENEKGMVCPIYKLGEEFDMTKPEDVGRFCKWAYHALFPMIAHFEFGGSFPWDPEPNKTVLCCPDPFTLVIFEIERHEKLFEGGPKEWHREYG